MEKETNSWEEIRKTGVLAFLLSLPILIWRSSKIGRTLALITFAMAMFWFMGRLSDVVFTKFINRWEARNESDTVLKSINATKENLSRVDRYLSDFDRFTERKIEERINSDLEGYRGKINALETELGRIERGIGIIDEKERESIKIKIINLRDLVLLKKQSIDSKAIRMEFETIFENLNLLSDEDRTRFKKDLTDMGFFLEESGTRLKAYSSGYSMVSTDFTMVSSFPYGED